MSKLNFRVLTVSAVAALTLAGLSVSQGETTVAPDVTSATTPAVTTAPVTEAPAVTTGLTSTTPVHHMGSRHGYRHAHRKSARHQRHGAKHHKVH
jgi:hypothetical protein